MMNRRNQILSLILIVQIAIGVFVFWPQSVPAGEVTTLFPELETSEIVSLQIEENVQSDENKVISLTKSGDGWVLPDADDFAANDTLFRLFIPN